MKEVILVILTWMPPGADIKKQEIITHGSIDCATRLEALDNLLSNEQKETKDFGYVLSCVTREVKPDVS